MNGCLFRRSLLLVWRPSSDRHNVLYLQNPSSSLLLKFISTKTKRNNQEGADSFTVSYLINSCGLSRKSALSASKHVRFQSPKKPDAVIDLLTAHAFSKKQISGMIRRLPDLLLADPGKTLLPKMNFLYSMGASEADVARLFSGYPWVFYRSLEKHIIPTVDALRDILHTEERVLSAVKRDMKALYDGLQINFIPNIETLRGNGVDESHISYLVHFHPSLLLTGARNFKEIVERAKGFGFSPSSSSRKFTRALLVIGQLSRASWERKFSVFHRWGWSEEMTLEAFQRYPLCMAMSEGNIMETMAYLVHEMGVQASYIMRNPTILHYSLGKRIKPRCSIIQTLASKGLVKRDYAIAPVINLPPRLFEQRFITRHLDKAPELLDLLKEEKIAA